MLKEIQRRGISLVALIITIIVLIILTGAVIMSITGENNTIDKANEAVFKNNMKVYQEQLRNNIVTAQMNGTIIGKSEVNASGSQEIKEWIPSVTEDYNEKLEIFEGELYYAGDIQQEQDWATTINMYPIPLPENAIENKVKVGDYIKYTPGAGTYVAKKEQTGHSADQTFTSVATEEDWRVLSVKGAEVTIVRQDPIYPTENSGGLTLFGQIGYDNAVQELNNICVYIKIINMQKRQEV